MHRLASGLVNPWFIGIFSVLMSALLALQHGEYAEQFLRWPPFLNFVGEHPFQARVLPFLLAKIASTFYRLGSIGLFQFFLSVDFIALCTASFFFWRTVQLLLDSHWSKLLALALFWWQLWATFVISRYHNYYYPYDMMSVAFISCGLWAIVSGQRLKVLLAVIIPAMFNRETAVIIPFFYLAFHWPTARQNTWRNFAVLLAVCLLIKMGLSHAFRAYDEMASLYHVPGFLRLYYNFSFVTLHPDLIHTANAFLAFGLVWLLLPWRWKQADQRLRRMMWCFVPYLLGMMVVANLAEIRIFAEFIPLMAILVAGQWMQGERDRSTALTGRH